MTAADIATALGDARREGRGWRCRCPLHGGRSLVLRSGETGRLLVTCWAGCDRLNVLAELRRRGLFRGGADFVPCNISVPRRHEDARTARALNIWRHTQHGAGTIAENYLASRGIMLDTWPASLRLHARCARPKDDAGNFVSSLRAMVLLVEHVVAADRWRCTAPTCGWTAAARRTLESRRRCWAGRWRCGATWHAACGRVARGCGRN